MCCVALTKQRAPIDYEGALDVQRGGYETERSDAIAFYQTDGPLRNVDCCGNVRLAGHSGGHGRDVNGGGAGYRGRAEGHVGWWKRGKRRKRGRGEVNRRVGAGGWLTKRASAASFGKRSKDCDMWKRVVLI